MSVFIDKYSRKCAEASYWMLYYPDHRADYEMSSLMEKEMDIILSTHPPSLVIGGKNSVRVFLDETSNKAIKLMSCKRGYIKEWLSLCEDIEASLNTELKVFLMLRRKYRDLLNKGDWKTKIQVNYQSELDRVKGTNPNNIEWISQSTLKEWWKKISQITAMEAADRGLFNPRGNNYMKEA